MQGQEAEVPVEGCGALVLRLHHDRHRRDAGGVRKAAPQGIDEQEGPLSCPFKRLSTARRPISVTGNWG